MLPSQGVTRIDAPTPEDEAEAIALILREALETPGRTAALVTRDRLLARRVGVRLEAWGIRVDDSAGRPLAKTMPGAFLDLVVAAHRAELRAGADDGAAEASADAPRPVRRRYPSRRPRARDRRIPHALSRPRARRHRRRARSRRAGGRHEQAASSAARDAACRALDCTAFAPLADIYASREPSALATLTRAHVAAAEACAALPEGDKARGLWDGEAGEAASLFFAGLLDETLPPLTLRRDEYPDLYRSLVARETRAPAVPLHPRLSIWGPLEARLQQPDVVDPRLAQRRHLARGRSTPARGSTGRCGRTLGLPAPEEKIGYAAHDFTMLLGAPTVVPDARGEGRRRAGRAVALADAARCALLEGLALRDIAGARRSRGSPGPQWRNRVVDAPAHRRARALPAGRAAPAQAVGDGVETWIANPYAIFAAPHPAPRAAAAARRRAGRGAARQHRARRAVGVRRETFPATLPDDPAAELMALVRSELEHLTGNPAHRRVLAAAVRALRAVVRRDRARPPRRRDDGAGRGRRASTCSPGRPDRSR